MADVGPHVVCTVLHQSPRAQDPKTRDTLSTASPSGESAGSDLSPYYRSTSCRGLSPVTPTSRRGAESKRRLGLGEDSGGIIDSLHPGLIVSGVWKDPGGRAERSSKMTWGTLRKTTRDDNSALHLTDGERKSDLQGASGMFPLALKKGRRSPSGPLKPPHRSLGRSGGTYRVITPTSRSTGALCQQNGRPSLPLAFGSQATS